MSYFAVITEAVASPEETAKYRDDHYKYIDKLAKEGKILMAGPFVDGSGGLIVLSVASKEEAEALISQDPYIKYKLRRYTIKEWKRAY
ncbi:MAG: YciI family protein [Aigarchaeota archaeon]|nr:YciI family protein [Aigarchaeota archaeon]MDW8092374.1 YciI family protein [Nitrososphaerota archaeon]